MSSFPERSQKRVVLDLVIARYDYTSELWVYDIGRYTVRGFTGGFGDEKRKVRTLCVYALESSNVLHPE